MKKNVMRACAVLMLLAMVFSMAACANANSSNGNVVMISLIYDENSPYRPANGGSVINNGGSDNSGTNNGGSSNSGTVTPAPTPSAAPSGNNSTTAPTTAAPSNNGGSNATTAPTTATPSNNGGSDTPAPSSDAPTEAPAADALPTDNAGILAKYKEVMDNTKKTIKTDDKLDWMIVKDLDVGSITGAVQGIINGVIKGEADAELQDDRDDQGKQIPPVNTAGIGCALTDASAVKEATCTDNGDGTATIKIVLNDEHNPEPMNQETGACSSKVGGIFACMSQPDAVNMINGYADKIPGASLVDLQLDYRNCTVVMTYDKAANHANSVEYTTPGYVSGSVKVFIPTINIVACMENHVRINDMKY